MELGAVFLVLAVLILVGMYLYAPFMSRRRRKTAQESHEVSSLLAERDRVINSLQELDFDFNLGKIPSEDYPAQRTALLQKGADVLRRLDEMTIAAHPSNGNGRGNSEEDRIEKAVAARRADASAEPAEVTDDDIESMIATRRKARTNKSAGFCPKCGKSVLVSDRFCPSCGKSLT
jgi:rubrerythrin